MHWREVDLPGLENDDPVLVDAGFTRGLARHRVGKLGRIVDAVQIGEVGIGRVGHDRPDEFARFQPPLPQGKSCRASVEVDDRRLHQQNRPEKGGVDFRRRRLGGDDRLVRVDRLGGGTNLRQRRPLDAAIDHRRGSDSRQAKANHSGNNERGDPIAAQAQNIRHFDYSVLVFACGRERPAATDFRLAAIIVAGIGLEIEFSYTFNSATLWNRRKARARIRASAIRRRSAPIIESRCYPLNLTWTIFPTFIAIAGENFRLSGSGSAS